MKKLLIPGMLIKCVSGNLSVHENAVVIRYLDDIEKEDLSLLTNDRNYFDGNWVEVLASEGLIVVSEIYCKPYDIEVPWARKYPWSHVFKK